MEGPEDVRGTAGGDAAKSMSENFLRQQERAENCWLAAGMRLVTDESCAICRTPDTAGYPGGSGTVFLSALRCAENSPDGKAPELVILETLQDPGNLGTILRAGEGRV